MISFYTETEMCSLFQEQLEENEAVNQLILGNMSSIKRSRELGNEIQKDTRFGVIFHEGRPAYFFCNFLPYAMVVTAAAPKAPFEPERYGKELAEEFNTNGVEITGIQACQEFAEAFIRHSKYKFAEDLSMDIMVATKIESFPLRGEIIRATMDDSQEVSEMFKNFARDALQQEETDQEAGEKAKAWLQKGFVWLYKVQGKTVGMNASTRQMSHGVSVSGVYIWPEERKKGYCKEMMAWCSQYYLDHGYDYVTLYVDKKNPFSNAAYTAVGYEYITGAYAFTIVEE